MFRSLTSNYLRRPSTSLIMYSSHQLAFIAVLNRFPTMFRQRSPMSIWTQRRLSEAIQPISQGPLFLAFGLTPENYMLSKAILSFYSPILDLADSPLLMPHLLTLNLPECLINIDVCLHCIYKYIAHRKCATTLLIVLVDLLRT